MDGMITPILWMIKQRHSTNVESGISIASRELIQYLQQTPVFQRSIETKT